MKNWSPALAKSTAAFCLLAMLCFTMAARAAEPLRVQARLVWGTDAKESPDKSHAPVEAAIAKRLTSAFKWKNYFEVSRKQATIAPGQKEEVKMSDHCTLDIKFLADGRVEVRLMGDGKHLSTIVDPLPEDRPLILAGSAKNDTAWAVVIQRLPKERK